MGEQQGRDGGTGDTLVSLCLAAAARIPDRPALIDAPDGAATTYGELADRLLRTASSLSAIGMRKGNVVAILAPNSASWVTLALGVMAGGGIVTGINPMLKPDEIARQITASGAGMLALASSLLPIVEAAGLGKLVREVIVLDGAPVEGARLLDHLICEGRPERLVPEPDDVALLPFSSGTSGLPKGVEITGRSLALSAASVRSVLGLGDTDVWLAASPFFHIVAVSGVLANAMDAGVPVVIVPVPELEAVLRAIERHRVTLTVLAPPAIRALAGHAAVERHDLTSLRAVGCTAAPLSAEIQIAAARRIDVPIFQAYGMTESVSAITIGPIGDPRPGSCGTPAPGFEIRVVDPETFDDVPPGSSGDIWVRSGTLMRGYRDDPGATAEAMTEDGWLRTGDYGCFDADGHLFIVGRLKELIKVNSSQVAPAELEALIAAYPGVADVAVVGRPSAATGECPVAYVVAPSPIDASALMEWVAERVAPFKRLHAVEFIEAVPRQLNGKIMRRLLGDMSAASGNTPGSRQPQRASA
jgi:acyl-CoA synthetase (AMP-forming)/AMP-acid ligase II